MRQLSVLALISLLLSPGASFGIERMFRLRMI